MNNLVRILTPEFASTLESQASDFLLYRLKKIFPESWSYFCEDETLEEITNATSLIGLSNLMEENDIEIHFTLCLNCSKVYYSIYNDESIFDKDSYLNMCPTCNHSTIKNLTLEVLRESEVALEELKRTEAFFERSIKEEDNKNVLRTMDLQRSLLNQFAVTLISVMENHLRTSYSQLMNLKYVKDYGVTIPHFEKTVKNDFANIEMANKHFKELGITIYGNTEDSILTFDDLTFIMFIQYKRNIVAHCGGINDKKVLKFYEGKEDTFRVKERYQTIYRDYIFYGAKDQYHELAYGFDYIGHKTQLTYKLILKAIEILKKLINCLNEIVENEFDKYIDEKFDMWKKNLNT